MMFIVLIGYLYRSRYKYTTLFLYRKRYFKKLITFAVYSQTAFQTMNRREMLKVGLGTTAMTILGGIPAVAKEKKDRKKILISSVMNCNLLMHKPTVLSYSTVYVITHVLFNRTKWKLFTIRSAIGCGNRRPAR